MKTTLATIKSFIKKNAGNLYIKNQSDFDPMTDCVQSCSDNGFREVVATEDNVSHTLGIQGAWFVKRSRDFFDKHSENGFRGYRVYNCCGSFVIAVKGVPAA